MARTISTISAIRDEAGTIAALASQLEDGLALVGRLEPAQPPGSWAIWSTSPDSWKTLASVSVGRPIHFAWRVDRGAGARLDPVLLVAPSKDGNADQGKGQKR